MFQENVALFLNVQKCVCEIEESVFQDIKKGRRQIDICDAQFFTL